MSNQPSLTIAPGKPDADIAKEYREEIAHHLGEIIKTMDEAKKRDMQIAFNISAADAIGKHHITNLDILKKL